MRSTRHLVKLNESTWTKRGNLPFAGILWFFVFSLQAFAGQAVCFQLFRAWDNTENQSDCSMLMVLLCRK